MRVVVITKNSFTQRDLTGVTKIEKSGTNIVITGVVVNPYTESFVAADVIVFIVSNS